MQKDSCGDSVADEGEGSGRGGYQAHISPRKREQQAEEGYGHRHDAKEKVGITQRPSDHDAEAGAAARGADAPDLPHGARQKHVAHHRGENDDEDGAPGVDRFHDRTPVGAPFLASFARSADFAASAMARASWEVSSPFACECSVRDGPPAIN